MPFWSWYGNIKVSYKTLVQLVTLADTSRMSFLIVVSFGTPTIVPIGVSDARWTVQQGPTNFALAHKFHTCTPAVEVVEHSYHAVVRETPAKSSLYTSKLSPEVNLCVWKWVYVIIKVRVIWCPSVSNMEDTEVTRTLGREGATHHWGWKLMDWYQGAEGTHQHEATFHNAFQQACRPRISI